MTSFRLIALLSLAFAGSGLLSCSAEQVAHNSVPANRPSVQGNGSRTNPEELGVLVRLPYPTEDIVWKEFPERKRLVAVMLLSKADADKMVANAGGVGTPEGSILVESWFPDELIAQSEMNGDNALRGTSYPATAFFQEPYSAGKITRVEGGEYFILELSSK